MTRPPVARSCGLALALTIAFPTVGLPRWPAGDVDPVARPTVRGGQATGGAETAVAPSRSGRAPV